MCNSCLLKLFTPAARLAKTVKCLRTWVYGKALLFQPGDISSRNKTYPKAATRAAGAESHHTFPFPGTVTSPLWGVADSQQLGWFVCSAWTRHLMAQCRPLTETEPVQYHCSSTGLMIPSGHNGSRVIGKKGSGQMPSWCERVQLSHCTAALPSCITATGEPAPSRDS